MKKYKVIALIGEAGTGKDMIKDQLVDDCGFHEIISCTTRPPREGEHNGFNYYFYSDEEFNSFSSEEMLESCEFNGWHYGTMINALLENEINIGVFNPEGIRSLLKRNDIDLTVFRLYARDDTRLIRQLDREPDPDIHEIIRRYQADEKDFKNLDFDYYKINNGNDDCGWFARKSILAYLNQ